MDAAKHVAALSLLTDTSSLEICSVLCHRLIEPTPVRKTGVSLVRDLAMAEILSQMLKNDMIFLFEINS